MRKTIRFFSLWLFKRAFRREIAHLERLRQIAVIEMLERKHEEYFSGKMDAYHKVQTILGVGNGHKN